MQLVPCRNLSCCAVFRAPLCCLQTGVLGGLQVWDERLGPSPVSRSKNSWGHTGCGLMDKQMSAQRQVRSKFTQYGSINMSSSTCVASLVEAYLCGAAGWLHVPAISTCFTAVMVVVFMASGFAFHYALRHDTSGHCHCALSLQLLCLDIHPSRPNLAATGASGGTVAIWDLRFQSAPLALTGSRPATGDVCQVGSGGLSARACTAETVQHPWMHVMWVHTAVMLVF